ncbi:hypothetical protein C0J50_16369, partial [Silurus asotus]
MESQQYDRFTSSETESTERYSNEAPLFTQNRQTRRFYLMFGFLTLFVLLLTLSVGIRISQVNQQVSDILFSLQTVNTEIKSAQTGHDPFHDPSVLIPERGSCESDWVFYKNKCYYMSTKRLNWHNAEKDCIQQKGHLLVVNNREEMEYISQLTSESFAYWIGLIEREEEGTWSWVDGTDFKSTEQFWDEGQPDDWNVRVNGEDCGQVHAKKPDSPVLLTHRLWNDADCTLTFKYICE